MKKNKNGIALVSMMFFTVILYSLSGIFIMRVINDNKMAMIEQSSAISFYNAHGGSRQALIQLDTLINDFLLDTISDADPSGVVNYARSRVNSGNGLDWLLYAVRDDNEPVLLENGDQAEYSDSGTLGNYDYQYNIILTEKEDPYAAGTDVWEFPYAYTIESTSTVRGVSTDISIRGDFTVRLQRDNFAKYALFTNEQETPGGTNVWFTSRTNFAGPVHTNKRFNFALNPSGTFEENVTQEEQRARFYNNGYTVLLNDEHNGTRDVPTFNSGFERDVDAIVLSSATEQQDMIDQATGGNTYGGNGIYVPNDGSSLEGAIYIRGNSNIDLQIDGNNNPMYVITQGGTTNHITIDQAGQQTTVFNAGTGSSVTYSGLPDGVDDAGILIYADGTINNLGGTVQENSTLTISSRNDIIISDHLRYASYSSAVGSPGDADYVPPSAEGYENMLGIVSWEGDVEIGASAPDNVEIHGTVLASEGIFQVDNYNDQGRGPRGTATLLGGAITDNYGAFGLFNGSTGQQVSGYGRNFVYDQRMLMGEAPPYFPSLRTFIAFSNDIVDKLIWQEGE